MRVADIQAENATGILRSRESSLYRVKLTLLLTQCFFLFRQSLELARTRLYTLKFLKRGRTRLNTPPEPAKAETNPPVPVSRNSVR